VLINEEQEPTPITMWQHVDQASMAQTNFSTYTVSNCMLYYLID